MLRRALCVLGTVASLALTGCQHQLAKDGSYSELTNHAMRLDFEFHRLHVDVKEIFFGIERDPEDPVWKIYDR